MKDVLTGSRASGCWPPCSRYRHWDNSSLELHTAESGTSRSWHDALHTCTYRQPVMNYHSPNSYPHLY